MYEKCIKCERIGESCVPNLMTLPFADLIKWCIARQKHLGWTNQMLADKSDVPVGTINRIKAGEYADCKYSTIKRLVVTLIGGITDEFPCNAQVEKELESLSAVEQENESLKNRLAHMDEQHRSDIRAVKEEYMQQITFLMDELKAWRTLHQNHPR